MIAECDLDGYQPWSGVPLQALQTMRLACDAVQQLCEVICCKAMLKAAGNI
jgi:hypothetical protein